MRAWIVVLGLALANGALAQETDGEPLEREDDGYAAMADESDAELEPAPPQPVTVEATPPVTVPEPQPEPEPTTGPAERVDAPEAGTTLELKIGAQVFGEYAVELLQEEIGGESVYHQFQLGRVWLWTEFAIAGARGRVLFEGARAANEGALVGVAGDSLVARFREAWAGYRAWDAIELRGGIVPALTAPTLTGLWGLRPVARTATRRFDLLDAADLGATLTGTLPRGFGVLGVGVYNGEGYEARERNRGKNIEAFAKIRPLAMIEGAEPLTLVLSYVDGSAGAGTAETDRLVGAVGWDCERFGAGAAVTWIRGFVDDGAREGLLAEGWARANPWRGLLVGARYTWLDQDRDADDVRRHELTATVGYRVYGVVAAFAAVDGRFGGDGVDVLDPTYDRWRVRLVVEGRFEAPFDIRLGETEGGAEDR
ncbi:MAG: hypothetical protein JJ863_05655 [Deltaproteobacteria bacterium]|nr:hypothetical protein [Deltaproteobacteria bacterium]